MEVFQTTINRSTVNDNNKENNKDYNITLKKYQYFGRLPVDFKPFYVIIK